MRSLLRPKSHHLLVATVLAQLGCHSSLDVGDNIGPLEQGEENTDGGIEKSPTGGTGGMTSTCPPSPEVCNGRDDDCDGVVDNGGVCPAGNGGSGGSAGSGGGGGSAGSRGAGGVAGSGGAAGMGGTGGAAGVPGTGGAGGSVGRGGSGGTVTAGLIGHWPFDEGSGARVADASGNGNHGVIIEAARVDATTSPAAPNWVAGAAGGALQLDGVRQFVRVASSLSLQSVVNNNAFTVSGWVRLRTAEASDLQVVVAQGEEAGTSFDRLFLGVDRIRRPVGYVHFTSAEGRPTITAGRWTHLATTYDGVTLTVYQDGVPTGGSQIGWPLEGGPVPLLFGAKADAQGRVQLFLDGAVDDVRLYNRVLTSAEIQRLASP